MEWKKIKKKLPVGSLVHYMNKGQYEDDKRGIKKSTQGLKFLGHLAYMAVPTAFLIWYSMVGGITREWNPLNQKGALKQHGQLIGLRNKRFDEAYKKLFIDPAYANKDKNKAINFEEKLDAWDRMGLLPDRPVFYNESFKDPNFKDLEKAVESYEIE